MGGAGAHKQFRGSGTQDDSSAKQFEQLQLLEEDPQKQSLFRHRIFQ
jgi:hypothetical protein